MSCYCSGHDLLRLCICCQAVSGRCRNGGTSDSQSEKLEANRIIQDIQRNFAGILEKQLQILSETKQNQIHSLEQTVSRLKLQISKLQTRNKLDKQNQSRLKQEVRRQSYRIKDLEEELNKEKLNSITKQQIIERKVVQKIEIPPKNDEGDRNKEISQLQQQIIKLKSRIFELEELNRGIIERNIRESKIDKDKINELSKIISEIGQKLKNKEDYIANLQNQKVFLSEKISILSKPTKSQVEPIILNKIITQPPEIRTVYVDRPIEKTKIVQVQKVVKQFIQPDRPVVNRIIQCPPSKKCRCDSDSEEIDIQQQYQRKQIIETQYNQVLGSYKQERQKLVNIIKQRDSDYRLLEKKIELCQRINAKPAGTTNCNHLSNVEVTVYKDGQKPVQTSSKPASSHERKGTVIQQKQKNNIYNQTNKNTRKR